MSDRTDTRYHNIDVLKSLGYRQVRNTTIFQKGNDFILSPAVAKGTNEKYWFDIREVNLEKIGLKALLLVRIVPDLFILETLESISSLLSKNLMDNRPNSGNVWGIHIHININRLSKTAYLYNIKKSNETISTKILSKNDIELEVDKLKENI